MRKTSCKHDAKIRIESENVILKTKNVLRFLGFTGDHLGQGSSELIIQGGIDLIEEIEGCGVMTLQGEDQRQRDNLVTKHN